MRSKEKEHILKEAAPPLKPGDVNYGNVYVEIQGKKITVREAGPPAPQAGGGGRKWIKEFTRASRMRMLREIATIDWESMGTGTMHTLTYPDECLPETPREATIQRHRYFRDAEKHVSEQIPMLWRVEWVPRKSGRYEGRLCPHIHLIAFDGGHIAAGVARGIWKKIIRAKRSPQVDLRRMDSAEMAAVYTAKYLSKVESPRLLLDDCTYLNTGRAWGFHRTNSIKRHASTVLLFSDPDLAALVKEITAAVSGHPNADWKGSRTLLGPWAADLLRLLQEELLTPAT